jgi:hypothetical protein
MFLGSSSGPSLGLYPFGNMAHLSCLRGHDRLRFCACPVRVLERTAPIRDRSRLLKHWALFIGMERDPDYFKIASDRIRAAHAATPSPQSDLFAAA